MSHQYLGLQYMRRVTPLITWISIVARDVPRKEAEILLSIGETLMTLTQGFLPMFDDTHAGRGQVANAQKRLRILEAFIRHGVKEIAEKRSEDLKLALETMGETEIEEEPSQEDPVDSSSDEP